MINIEKFVNIRKKRKISQNDLSEGICTQTTLSNFESGKKIPSFKILNELCERLGIIIGDIVINSSQTKIGKNLHQVDIAYLNYDFRTVFNLLTEINENEIISPDDLIHFYYLNGLYILENDQNYPTALNYFEKILNNFDLTDEDLFYLLALNSKAQVYYKTHENDQAQKYYERLIEPITKLPIEDNFMAARLLFILHQAGDYFSIFHYYKTADRLLRYGYQIGSKFHQVYYMGRILYRLGQNAMLKDSKKMAKQYLHDARAFARFNHDQYVSTKAKQLLAELEIQ